MVRQLIIRSFYLNWQPTLQWAFDQEPYFSLWSRLCHQRDAIAVALDHRDDYSVIVIFPYSFKSDGKLEIEAPFVTKKEDKIFSH